VRIALPIALLNAARTAQRAMATRVVASRSARRDRAHQNCLASSQAAILNDSPGAFKFVMSPKGSCHRHRVYYFSDVEKTVNKKQRINNQKIYEQPIS
jgi:hypothetical protein